MKKIIGVIRPFQLEQSIMVYEDGNKIDILQSTLEDLGNSIYSLSKKHDVTRVDLAGPKRFIEGVKDGLDTEYLQKKFELDSKIEINII